MTINTSGIYKISKIISNIFNPLVSLVVYLIYYSYRNDTWIEACKKFVPILLLLIIPIILWISRNVKKGNYSNMDVSDRKQRHSLYLFIIALTGVYVVIDYIIHQEWYWPILMLCVLLILMQISNLFIKSSMHTGLNIYVASLFYAIEPAIGIFWLGLAILIGITRVIIKRHTIPEVLSGAIIAIFISLIYLRIVNSPII